MSSLGINLVSLRRVKFPVILALVFGLVIISLTGCNNQQLSGSRFNSPIEMNYTVNNLLTFEEHKGGNGSDFNYMYLTVGGLKNKEIEEAINDRIKTVYNELRIQDIPPYRGIRAQIPGRSEIVKEQIYASVTGNFNHVLSIMMTKSVNYQDPGAKAYSEKDPAYFTGNAYFSETETLNFDLNTGDEIKLKDLFCDDVDAMELLNNHMSRLLSESYAEEEGYYYNMYTDIKLVESFKGLSEDQRFAVYPYGIALVFDYRTPQFETGCMSMIPMVYFSDLGNSMAITERYYNDGEDIFTSTEPLTKSLVMKTYEGDISGNDYYQDGLVNIYIRWRYSSAFPEEIKNRLNQLRSVDEEKIREMNQIYSRMSEIEINEKGPGTYEVMVYGDQIGGFVNVSRNSSQYMPDYFEQKMDYQCFDSKTQKELKLEDLFVEGYDYKPVVMQAIRKAIGDYDGIYEETASTAANGYSDLEIEEIYNSIDGFSLSTDEMYIPISHPKKGNNTYGLSAYIPYKDFGCENMTIFKQ